MDNISTAKVGIQLVKEEIERRGGLDLSIVKEGHREFIIFRAPDGRQLKITTRTKRSGTWQTMTTYGKPRMENPLENEFWIFVDLELDPAKFHVVPFWWISNDIHQTHEAYLKSHGGHRARNDHSKHHAIKLERIRSWEGQWQQIGI